MQVRNEAQELATPRPRVWLDSVSFKSGTNLVLARHEVIVVVGPNNSGKSVLLRELEGWLTHGLARPLVVSGMTLETSSTPEELVQWAHSITSQRILLAGGPNPPLDLPYGRVHQSQILNEWKQGLSGQGFSQTASIFSTLLTAAGRLSLTQSTGAIDSANAAPTNPIQHLFENEDIELRLSDLVSQAFGQELVVNRGAGSQIHLHLGERPKPLPGSDRLSKEFRQAVHDMQLVSDQGDGVKAFVGLLLNTLVLDRDITLIDEPEAFLHPPQARLLGRVLATEIPKPRQLIVATHSSDVLRGLLDDPLSPVRVLRVRRNGPENAIAELNPELVREVWRDPLLRYSGVFDGLFHQGVIVCESDSDCRFYEAVMNAIADEGRTPDLLLVHGAGKSRVPAIVRALRAIEVPVRTVFDFDVLGDESVLSRTVEAMGANWDDFVSDWKIVRSAIENKRPELQTKDVRDQVSRILEAVRTEVLPNEAAKEIKNVLRSASPWSEAKKIGKPFVPRGDQTAVYERLADALQKFGIYIVEVGELEGFCPSVGNHGPAWTVSVLERDLASDPELSAARDFARALQVGW